jgi:penicillin-binding protein 2
MQLAHAIAAIANDGVAYKPHLVRQITDAVTGEIRPVVPVIDGRLPLKPENITFIKHALAGVAKEGTSARAFAKAPYTSAGKTGTAQVFSLKGEKYVEGRVTEKLRDHAWYIAYAPAEQPTIALAILVENSGFGGAIAAPMARAVFDYHLLGKLPDPQLKKVPEANVKDTD